MIKQVTIQVLLACMKIQCMHAKNFKGVGCSWDIILRYSDNKPYRLKLQNLFGQPFAHSIGDRDKKSRSNISAKHNNTNKKTRNYYNNYH